MGYSMPNRDMEAYRLKGCLDAVLSFKYLPKKYEANDLLLHEVGQDALTIYGNQGATSFVSIGSTYYKFTLRTMYIERILESYLYMRGDVGM